MSEYLSTKTKLSKEELIQKYGDISSLPSNHPLVILKNHRKMLRSGGYDKHKETQIREIETPLYLFNKKCSVMHKYTVTKALGAGGFGAVFAAVRKHDDKAVAFKLISRKSIPSWCNYKGTLVPTEIHIMSLLKDVPGVVQMYEIFERSDSYIVVMERPDPSMDLFDYITRRRFLSEIESSYIMKDLMITLKQIHAIGVVHRDIKDENILINMKTRRIKLIDFGGAAPLKKGYYQDFDGTRVYSPPEWVAFNNYSAIPACVWSLGILTFNMIYGDVPFDRDELIINGKPDFNIISGVSNVSISFISKCLTHIPSKRPSINTLLADPFITLNTVYSQQQLLDIIKNEEKTLTDMIGYDCDHGLESIPDVHIIRSNSDSMVLRNQYDRYMVNKNQIKLENNVNNFTPIPVQKI